MKLLNKYCFSGVFVAFFNFNGNVLAAERLYVSASYTEAKTSDINILELETTRTYDPAASLLLVYTDRKSSSYNAGIGDSTGSSISFGYDNVGSSRMELELGFNEYEVESVSGGTILSAGDSLESKSLAFNYWYDVGEFLGVNPYVGFGLGGAEYSMEGESSSSFEVMLGAGLSYKFTRRLVVDFSARYKKSSEYEFIFASDDNTVIKELNLEQDKVMLMLGIRYNFF
ncbi:MAG: opacity protein-like surface antigen [Zhongshania marina]|jgi:opacity protein-like surface antigen